MLNIIIYTWKRLIRNKINTFWILCFPIVLGTLFNIAFSSLASGELMNTIPVAVVCEDDEYGTALKSSIDSMSEGDDAIFEANYCHKDEAIKLLENQEVTGIIYSGSTVKLTISSAMTVKEPTSQSIIDSFVDQYNMYQDSIIEIAKTHPEKLADIMEKIGEETNYNPEVTISRKPTASPFTQYFYNLLTMTCMYTALGGVIIAAENQANLTTLAARKSLSPTHKLVTITGEVIATTVYEYILNLVGFAYLAFVLKIDILSRLPLAILSIFVGCLFGVSLGFFTGSIGHKSKEFKQGMVFAVTMPLCFLSGLMMGNIKIIIQDVCPIINKLNPATILTDCFYSLAIFESYDRFTYDIVVLLIYVLIFGLTGFFFTRRQKYASI